MDEFIAKCGINCAVCPSFRENLITAENRQRCSEGWAKYLGFRLSPDKLLRCDGCQTSDDGDAIRYQSCIVRRCALKTGVTTCAQCSVFPCREVPTVSLSAEARGRIAARLGESIPEPDYLTYIEPYEGMKRLEVIRSTLDPADMVEEFAVKPLKARVVDFPDVSSLSREEIAAYQSVHRLIGQIISAQAPTYARQLLFKRRRPHILGLLWIVARYGEFDEENGSTLILDGVRFGSQKECSWLVRKRDNSFHGAAREAARLVEDLGVIWDFESFKGGWLLKLTFKEALGGVPALNALKQYAVGLAETYGDPTYVGNTKYKGKAFALFSRADMQAIE